MLYKKANVSSPGGSLFIVEVGSSDMVYTQKLEVQL